MNLLAKQIYGNKTAVTYNTYIGGVSSTISTAALLATKLGISVGNISNFTVVGSDIKCKITGSYAIPNVAFKFNTTPCTYYRDSDYLVTSLGSDAFYFTNISGKIDFENATSVSDTFNSTPLLTEILLKNATSVANSGFIQSTNGTRTLKTCYIPSVTSLGSTSGDNGVFTGNCVGLTIYAHPSLQTNNAGGVDGDLVYAISNGAIVRYVTNFTAPNAVTDLSAGTIYNTAIQLNFTPPSSTNSIEYYEVYVNGVFKHKITGSSKYVGGLTASTNYNIQVYAVDIFYNKSVSNILNITTTTSNPLDADSQAYIIASTNYQFEIEVNDLFASLKSNSLYTKIHAFYLFLGNTPEQAKWNAKNPLNTDAANRLIFTGTPLFSNSGYMAGGGHANTFLIPNSVQNVNNNGITVVIGTNNSANANDTAMGAFGSGSNASWIVVKGNNTTFLRESRINFAAVQQTGINEAKGIWTGVRQSSTVSKFFRNNSLIGSVTATGTLPTYPIWIGDLNNNGSTYGSTSQRIQFTSIHEGFSDSEVSAFHSIINTFENALGRKTW